MLDRVISKLKYLFVPCQANEFRPKILGSSFLYYYAILLLLFKVITISAFFYFPKTSFFADITKTSLIQMANQDRQEQGLSPLADSPKLDQAALLKAQDMLANGYFAHVSPTGVTPWYWFSKVGYNYKYAGENLAIGFVDSSEVNQAWLASPSHRANILSNKYSQIGMAVLTGDFQGSQTTVVVQLFGTQQTQAVVAGTSVKTSPLPKAPQPSATPVAPLAAQEASSVPAAGTAINSQPLSGQVLSASTENNSPQTTPAAKLFSFLTSSYDNILEYLIYGSLFLVISLLVVTVLIDIFVYKAYEIQHKDIVLKTVVLCTIFGFLLLIDKSTIVSLIPHNLGIY